MEFIADVDDTAIQSLQEKLDALHKTSEDISQSGELSADQIIACESIKTGILLDDYPAGGYRGKDVSVALKNIRVTMESITIGIIAAIAAVIAAIIAAIIKLVSKGSRHEDPQDAINRENERAKENEKRKDDYTRSKNKDAEKVAVSELKKAISEHEYFPALRSALKNQNGASPTTFQELISILEKDQIERVAEVLGDKYTLFMHEAITNASFDVYVRSLVTDSKEALDRLAREMEYTAQYIEHGGSLNSYLMQYTDKPGNRVQGMLCDVYHFIDEHKKSEINNKPLTHDDIKHLLSAVPELLRTQMTTASPHKFNGDCRVFFRGQHMAKQSISAMITTNYRDIEKDLDKIEGLHAKLMKSDKINHNADYRDYLKEVGMVLRVVNTTLSVANSFQEHYNTFIRTVLRHYKTTNDEQEKLLNKLDHLLRSAGVQM